MILHTTDWSVHHPIEGATPLQATKVVGDHWIQIDIASHSRRFVETNRRLGRIAIAELELPGTKNGRLMIDPGCKDWFLSS
jgi:hypothetical protein